jgi:hypothetical protein
MQFLFADPEFAELQYFWSPGGQNVAKISLASMRGTHTVLT